MKNKLWLITTLVLMLVAVPTVMAATAMTVPVTGGNYTTALTITMTTDTTTVNKTNMTCLYNASGGDATVLLASIVNTSAGQTTFTTTTAALSSETATYNITCSLYNLTTINSTKYASLVTIDGTDPSESLTLGETKITAGKKNTLTWSISDALSGLSSYNVSVTSPNADTCPTQSWSTTSTTDQEVVNTGCSGTYTVTLTATDISGNSVTDTQTFTTRSIGTAGWQDTASSATGTQNAQDKSNRNIVIGIVIAIVIYALFFRKK